MEELDQNRETSVNKDILLSFIDEKTVILDRSIKTVEELRELVNKCRNSEDKRLSGYDFSNINEISCVCFDGLSLENVVFSRFFPDKKERPLMFQLSFVGATLHNVSFAYAQLRQCNFDKLKRNDDAILDTTLTNVDFFFSEFDYCRFRGTKAQFVDFRYSKVDNCTMGDFHVTLGDFYFSNFMGCTNFIDSSFKLCSFTCASFDNSCIRMGNIDRIVQEDDNCYHHTFLYNQKIHWNRYNPCSSISSINNGDTLKSKVFIASEAMNFYKQMSGIYAGKGLNRDSNEAYRKRVLMERKYCRLKMRYIRTEEGKKEIKDLKEKGEKYHGMWYYRRGFWKTILVQGLGFGYMWGVPCLLFLLLVFVYWVIYQLTDSSVGYVTPEWLQHVAFSLNNALSPFSEYYEVVNIFVSSIQSTIGVLLVGFLGFVIANKIRNDS